MIVFRIVRKLLKLIHLYNAILYYTGKNNLYSNYQKDKKIFFMMTPTYGNLGDQAIEFSTTMYLCKYFSEYKLIKIHLEDTYSHLKSVKKAITTNDFIVLQGGGNFGNLYMEVEHARRYIVKKISNKIISFPSTITYTDDFNGRFSKFLSKRIYNKHKNLTIISREESSYNFSKKNFYNCTNLIYPDIVFFLAKRKEIKRNGILLCLRNDKEAVIGQDFKCSLIKEVFKSEGFENCIITDNQVSRDIDDSVKTEEIQSLLNQFYRASVVVTDRLHGLILSVVCSTPCIVMPSLDHKILGTYSWLKDINFVHFEKEFSLEKILSKIAEFKDIKEKSIVSFDTDYFLKLKKNLQV